MSGTSDRRWAVTLNVSSNDQAKIQKAGEVIQRAAVGLALDGIDASMSVYYYDDEEDDDD